MKASVCVLFAVACWVVSQADESPMILTLGRVMSELGKIKKAMVKSPTLINSPIITNDLKDCCTASALESFRHNMTRVRVTDPKLIKVQGKISRELGKKIIVNGLPICKPEETQKAQCESSYREVDSQTFVQNFQTLLEKMFARLFVDENLDRMVPISKQPKEKIQAIISPAAASSQSSKNVLANGSEPTSNPVTA